MSQVFVQRYIVDESDIDYLGHASNIAYVKWVQDSTVAHSEARGLSVERYKELGGIFVIRRNSIDYLRSAVLGDELEIRTQVTALVGAKAERLTEFVRVKDGALIARAETTWVFFDYGIGRPVRVPTWVREAFGVAPVVRSRSLSAVGAAGVAAHAS